MSERSKGAAVVLGIASVVVIAGGMKLAAAVVVPLLLAGFVATVTSPLVLWLCARGVPRPLAVTAAVLVDVAFLAILGILIGQSVNRFYSSLPSYQARLAEYTSEVALWLQGMGLDVTAASVKRLIDPASLMGMVGVLFKNIAGLVSNLLLVVVIVVFMLFEAAGLRQKIEGVLPTQASYARIERAAAEVNKYLLVKTATSAATGLIVGIWVALWDLDLPILWGILAFLLNYVPTIGSIVAAVPPILLALLQFGPGAALGIGLGYFAINFSLGSFLEPRILGRALGLSPLVVFLSVIFWGWLLGPIGALLSVPLTMIAKIFLMNSPNLRWIGILLSSSMAADEARAQTLRELEAREAPSEVAKSQLYIGRLAAS